jgi:hypothetical protein
MATTSEHANRNRTIINLAYEGVPQRAIARALQLPANEVGEVVADAVARGIIDRPSFVGGCLYSRNNQRRPGMNPPGSRGRVLNHG